MSSAKRIEVGTSRQTSKIICRDGKMVSSGISGTMNVETKESNRNTQKRLFSKRRFLRCGDASYCVVILFDEYYEQLTVISACNRF